MALMLVGLTALAALGAAISTEGSDPEDHPLHKGISDRHQRMVDSNLDWPNHEIPVAAWRQREGTANELITLRREVRRDSGTLLAWIYPAASIMGTTSGFLDFAWPNEWWNEGIETSRGALLILLYGGHIEAELSFDLVRAVGPHHKISETMTIGDLERLPALEAQDMVDSGKVFRGRELEGILAIEWAREGVSADEHPVAILRRLGIVRDDVASLFRDIVRKDPPYWVNPSLLPTSLEKAQGKWPLQEWARGNR